MFSHLQFKPPKWFLHKFQRFTSDLLSRHHFIRFPPPDKSFCRATSCSLKALLCRQNLGDTTYKYSTMLELNILCASIIWLHICVIFWRNETGGARINVAMCFWQRIHTIVFPISRINSVILTSLINIAQYSVGNKRGSWNFKRAPFKQKLIHGLIIIQKALRDFSTSLTWSKFIGFMDFKCRGRHLFAFFIFVKLWFWIMASLTEDLISVGVENCEKQNITECSLQLPMVPYSALHGRCN